MSTYVTKIEVSANNLLSNSEKEVPMKNREKVWEKVCFTFINIKKQLHFSRTQFNFPELNNVFIVYYKC